jgi:hypothetical protein
MTTTATQKREDRLHALDTLAHIADNAENGGLVVITIKSTSKSNLSFKFDVRQYYNPTASEKIESLYLNWTYAQLMDMRQNERGEVKGSGIGIDRAFEVANNLEWLIERHLNKTVKIRFEGVY